jgi:hypothetical protein
VAFRSLSYLLTYPLHSAEVSKLELGLFASSFGTPALTDEVVGFGFQVEAQFVIHIGGRIGAEKTGIAAPKRRDGHRISSGSGNRVAASTLATAAAYASHVLTSWRN